MTTLVRLGSAEWEAPGDRGLPGEARARWGTLAAVGLSTSIALADFMAVPVTLPAVQRATGATFPELCWVLEAFVLTLAAFLGLSGYLVDRFGRRMAFLAGITTLLAGSVLAGATSLAPVLIVARAVQGAGAALVLPTGAALLPEAFSEGGGRLALALWSGATGLAVAASPLAGGLVTTYLGWRAVFFIEAAVAAVAALVAATTAGIGDAPTATATPGRTTADRDRPSGERLLGDSHLRQTLAARPGGPARRPACRGPFDRLGLGLLVAAFAVVVAGLVRTTANLDGWLDTGVLACFMCAGLLLVAFLAVESVVPAPVFPLSLLRKRTFAGSAAAAFGVSMGVLGPFMVLAFYLSYGLSYGAAGTGLRLSALAGVTLPLAALSAPLSRYVPAKTLFSVGLGLVAAGLYFASRLSTGSSWVDLVPGLVMAGIGLELVNPRLGTAAAASVEHQLVREASRINSTVRQLGVATGIAVAGSVFATRITDAISQQLPAGARLSGDGPFAAGLVLQGRVGQAASLVGKAVVKASFTSAMHDVLVTAAVAAAVCALLSLVVRSADVPRRTAPKQALPAGRARERVGARTASAPTASAPTASAPPAGAPTAGEALSGAVAGSPTPVSHPPEADGPPATTPAPRLPRRSGGFMSSIAPEGYLVTGSVTDEGGVAIAGARLTLVGARGEHTGEASSEEDGSFSIDAGEAGSYTLVAAAQHYRATAKVVRVGPGGVRTGLQLLGTGSLEGKVTAEKGASPLEAELELRAEGGGVAMRARAGHDGTFFFRDVLEGTYELAVSAKGHGTRSVAVTVPRGATGQVALSLGGRGHLYGAVRSPKGEWRPGVGVSLELRSGQIVAATRTDSAGSYCFEDVPEGGYLIRAENVDAVGVEVGAGSTMSVDLTTASSHGLATALGSQTEQVC
jgi:hypothetical protein